MCILLVIAASSIALAAEDPVLTNSERNKVGTRLGGGRDLPILLMPWDLFYPEPLPPTSEENQDRLTGRFLGMKKDREVVLIPQRQV